MRLPIRLFSLSPCVCCFMIVSFDHSQKAEKVIVVVCIVRLLDSLRGSSVNIGTIQRKSAWPLRKDDTHKPRSVSMQCLMCLRKVFDVCLWSIRAGLNSNNDNNNDDDNNMIMIIMIIMTIIVIMVMTIMIIITLTIMIIIMLIMYCYDYDYDYYYYTCVCYVCVYIYIYIC